VAFARRSGRCSLSKLAASREAGLRKKQQHLQIYASVSEMNYSLLIRKDEGRDRTGNNAFPLFFAIDAR
jgi:hypothetical protein